jgi:hypothetical protein
VIGFALVACEKSNDVIAREQIEQSRNACPQGCLEEQARCHIKGNVSTGGIKIYHRPGGPAYPNIVIQPERGERWFCTEEEAIRNGFRLTPQEQR